MALRTTTQTTLSDYAAWIAEVDAELRFSHAEVPLHMLNRDFSWRSEFEAGTDPVDLADGVLDALRSHR